MTTETDPPPVRIPVYRLNNGRGARFSGRGRPFGVIVAPPGSRLKRERRSRHELFHTVALWLPSGESLSATLAAAAATRGQHGLSWGAES